MNKKNSVFYFVFLVVVLALASLSFSTEVSPNVSISTSAKSVEDIYKPAKTRDPFIQSYVYISKTNSLTNYDEKLEPAKVSISTATDMDFSVLGIMEFYGNKEALLKNKNGEAFVCNEGNLYDSKRKPVKGWKCLIKGKEITIIDPKGKSQKLLMEK